MLTPKEMVKKLPQSHPVKNPNKDNKKKKFDDPLTRMILKGKICWTG